ncbi:GntR family transcriptional regulator [Pradoshia sp. D12]|jgi:DNA-binding GntR family transcriptional regulator|uniref:GntR family transcriptional regulator n=2 Tax=Bacillales TaxID=1385 RepID=UPI00111278E8|nr:GntR family transcriptional regulator [Bacillus sp. D12]QFK70259.1 GntR family transcriptional regulator [Pradoshia sp. D12]TPF71039.1 GntR family transcriptional regulator [Bacillus sp. D12]
MMLTVTPKLPGENNKHYSYRIIKNGIMSLELKPGQAISEIELANELRISRTPIREVIGKLKEEHLVEVWPQVGSYISKIDYKLVKEAAFMRSVLEKEVLKLACESISDETLLELKKVISLQENFIGKKGMERTFHELDQEFHSLFYKDQEKDHIWDAINRLSTHYNRIRLLSEIEYDYTDIIKQHKNIIDIIENKKVDQIDEAVSHHILGPEKYWNSLLEPDSQYAEYFVE